MTNPEFLRRASLAAAFRLHEQPAAAPTAAVPPEKRKTRFPRPARKPEPERQPAVPHYAATYASFEAYRNESPFADAGVDFPPGGVMRNV